MARLQRSLTRAAAITDGLLEFARAGAHPEPGARASVRDDRDPRRIAIRALERGSTVRVEVSDTGPGIAEDVLPRLFELPAAGVAWEAPDRLPRQQPIIEPH